MMTPRFVRSFSLPAVCKGMKDDHVAKYDPGNMGMG